MVRTASGEQTDRNRLWIISASTAISQKHPQSALAFDSNLTPGRSCGAYAHAAEVIDTRTARPLARMEKREAHGGGDIGCN